MTSTSGNGQRDIRLEAQVALMQGDSPAEDRPRAWPPTWRADGLQYHHRQGHLLVRDEDIARVRRALDGGDPIDARDNNINGLTLFGFNTEQHESVEAACQVVDARLGRGIATPDHLLYLVHVVSTCPATEPETVRTDARPIPEPSAESTAGAGVRVQLLDSGWLPEMEFRPWLNGVTGDIEDPYAPGSTEIRSYAGHGSFSAGIVRSVAPAAEVFVAKAFSESGTVFESDLVAQMLRAVGDGADVLSLSFGTYTRGDIPLLGFDVVQALLRSYKGVVLVAAAGNDGGRHPFWPAASPWTVSVGALSTSGRHRAWFSNYGGWVDVYAPGEDLVSVYPTGTFTCIEPPNAGQVRSFEGMARWSGTSFSAPVVAGLIAARMSATGENGQQAAAAVLTQARAQAIPGVGAALFA